jgi:hypothetical protein
MANNEKSGIIKFIANLANKFKTLAAVITVLGIVFGAIIAGSRHLPIPAERVQAILGVLNFIVLVVYCLVSRKAPKLKLKKDSDGVPDETTKYCELLNIKIKGAQDGLETAKRKETRVNLLVEQLHRNIKWYAIFLIIVYLVYTFDNKYLLEDVLKFRQGFYNEIHQYFTAAVGICNYLSAVFIFLAFKVLYNKTIDDDVTPVAYYDAEVFISIIILLGYISFSGSIAKVSLADSNPVPTSSLHQIKTSIAEYEKAVATLGIGQKGAPNAGDMISQDSGQNAKADGLDPFHHQREIIAAFDKRTHALATDELARIQKIITSGENRTGEIWVNRLQLFIGSLNGLAMALLFGRYISMEQTAYDMKTGEYAEWEYKNLIHISTICILPIYAIAQPLFGLFEIDAFGDPGAFANLVFFVCLIGKALFLFLTYILMKHRLTHLYLHSVVNGQGVPEDIVDCFKFNKTT